MLNSRLGNSRNVVILETNEFELDIIDMRNERVCLFSLDLRAEAGVLDRAGNLQHLHSNDRYESFSAQMHSLSFPCVSLLIRDIAQGHRSFRGRRHSIRNIHVLKNNFNQIGMIVFFRNENPNNYGTWNRFEEAYPNIDMTLERERINQEIARRQREEFLAENGRTPLTREYTANFVQTPHIDPDPAIRSRR